MIEQTKLTSLPKVNAHEAMKHIFYYAVGQKYLPQLKELLQD